MVLKFRKAGSGRISRLYRTGYKGYAYFVGPLNSDPDSGWMAYRVNAPTGLFGQGKTREEAVEAASKLSWMPVECSCGAIECKRAVLHRRERK